MTRVICEKRDCKHWVDGQCSKEEIHVKEKTISTEEEVAVCNTYGIIAGYC